MRSLHTYLFLALCSIIWEEAAGHQIYLKKITIHKSHERLWDRNPEVKIRCEGDGIQWKSLERVRDVGQEYGYGKEVLAVTHVDEDQCRNCTLIDKDLLSGDDTFGTIELCHSDFTETGKASKSVEGEFDAQFACPGCVPIPPALPVYITASANASSSFTSVFGKESSHVWQSPWFIGFLVGLTLIGLVFGGVSYHYYQSLREKAERERIREFESILGDPDVDFEAMVDQDNKAFNKNFWRKFQWKPRTWLSVRTHDDDYGTPR